MSARTEAAPSVIRLEGTFDLPAARLLERSLTSIAGRVRVDFTGVRRFNDFAVAVLAQALKRAAEPGVKVEGLTLHQIRLLRYFGVDAQVFRREAP